MRIIAEEGSRIVLTCERSEEVLEALRAFAAERSIKGATLTGLGACDKLDIAYYNLADKKYERHEIDEELEILSLTGNIGVLDGAPILHIHGTFGRRDLSTLGGHLFALHVSGTCEIHLTTFEPVFNRAHDGDTGLNLLCATTA